jgi:cobalt-zinc-cadmium resistance protein CzcA
MPAMLNKIIDFSLKNRLLVCLLAVALVVIGGRALTRLPIDAFPDTTPVQVQINTAVPALSPEEAEQQVTIPVELAVSGLPGLENVRSISKFGLSQVVATFEDKMDIYRARQLIMERLQEVELPAGIERPTLGPISTGLGEVFHYVVRSTDANRSLTDLREIHDWLIKPQLQQVRGVAEVNSWGGFEKQYHVVADPDRLIKHGITFAELVEALQANNQNAGGGQVVRGGEALLVQGLGLATDIGQIGNIVITSHDGAPIRVRDVATVKLDHEIRRGAVTAEGKGEAVLGLGFMLMGENSAVVTHALKEKLAEVQMTLPKDIVVETLYDRTELVEKVIRTVQHNLLAGALLVIALLFAFLGNLRAGLIVASAIPLSMLFAGNFMLQAGIAASLLSLGAIDFGLIVDSSVIMVENCVRHVARHSSCAQVSRSGCAQVSRPRTSERPQVSPGEQETFGQADGAVGRPAPNNKEKPAPNKKSHLEIIRDAAIEVRKPTMFGELIIMIVFLPVLALEGIEGKLFRPMALTMIFALAGSMILSLTLMPVLASLLLPEKLSEREPWLVRIAHRLYVPTLNWVLRWRALTIGAAIALVAGAGLLAVRMGGEFLPKLGEQALAVSTVRLAGVSLDEAVALNNRLEKELLAQFPDEIEHIWTRLGTAEVATDPMGIELTDFFIALQPRAKWKKARTQRELVEQMRQIFNKVPGMTAAFSQPIEMRMNEMIAGARGDVAIKIYGDDLDTLRQLSDQVRDALESIAGSSEVSGEQMTGQPVLRVKVDPDAIARFGVSTRDVLSIVEAVGATKVGEVREGQRRFPLAVRLPDRQRADPDALAATLIPTAGGPVLPLERVAKVSVTEGPSTINREWGRRRTTVQANVSGRDVASYVAEAKTKMPTMPAGYTLEWGGQFQNMERANRKMTFVVPVALGLIFVLLYFSLGRLRDVLIVATGIPLSAVGGVLALWLRDMPFTVSAGIGFVALSGVAMLNGLVVVTFIKQELEAGMPLDAAIRQGCQVRLRPVLMTALVAAVGFVPMAVNVGVGGEVQRPLATVVIGGILSDTLLTLLVLPVLYRWLGRKPA